MKNIKLCETYLKNNLDFLGIDNYSKILNNIYSKNKNLLSDIKYKNKNLYSENNPYSFIEKQFLNSKKHHQKNLLILTNGIGLSLKYIIDKKFYNFKNIFLIMFNYEFLYFLLQIIELDKLKFNLSLVIIHKNSKNNEENKNLQQKCFFKKNIENYSININFCDSNNLLSFLNSFMYESFFISFQLINEIINIPEIEINKDLISMVIELIQFKIKSLNTIVHFSKRWKNNIINNFKLFNHFKIKKLVSLKKNILIFASSPNTELFLKLNIKYLNIIKNHFVIFSLPSTLNILKIYNIDPDFLFTFDGSFFNYFNFPHIKNYNIITSLILYHSILKTKINNNIFLINLNTPIEKIIFKNVQIPYTTFHSSSVNTLISYLTNDFKNKKIYIIGSDYKNISRRSHHRYYELYNFTIKNSNYFKTPLSWESKLLIISSSKYNLYKKELENYLLKNQITKWTKDKNNSFISIFRNIKSQIQIKEDLNKKLFISDSQKYEIAEIENKNLINNIQLFKEIIKNLITQINSNKSINNEYINLLTFLFTKKIINIVKQNFFINYKLLINDCKYLLQKLSRIEI